MGREKNVERKNDQREEGEISDREKKRHNSEGKKRRALFHCDPYCEGQQRTVLSQERKRRGKKRRIFQKKRLPERKERSSRKVGGKDPNLRTKTVTQSGDPKQLSKTKARKNI